MVATLKHFVATDVCVGHDHHLAGSSIHRSPPTQASRLHGDRRSVLTVGIGVNAGVFGIINGLMIRPLAGASAPGEVVGVFSKDRTAARDYRPFSYPGFSDLRDADGPFAHLAGHTVALAGFAENNTTRQATVDTITTGFLETLGGQPVYGRDFTMEEERPRTSARSVIVSYKLWERSGLDRDILKQTVRINGQEFVIVGVAPQHFTGTTILGPSFTCRSACTTRSPATSTPIGVFRFRIAAAAR